MIPIPSILAIIGYLICTGLITMCIGRVIKGEGRGDLRLLRGLWLGSWLLHAATLYTLVITPDGLDLGFYHALSTVTWLMVLLLLLASFRRPLENLGVVLLPLAALSVFLEIVLPGGSFRPGTTELGLEFHIFIALLSYSILSLAALQAAVLAVQNQNLHEHRPGGFIRALPPLQHMESLLFQMIGLGFALLSVTLATGFIYLEDMFAQRVAHKTVLSIAAWIIFAILLWGRLQFGWRGRIAIRWTLGGFVALLLAFLGSKLVLEVLLQR
jgi:ABC-type uncharacterized transport system permease subunit